VNNLGTPADFTTIVMLIVIGVAVWFMWDRLAQLQRDVEALKHKLEASKLPKDVEAP
jgi:HAMP domain-containing protein